jgi:hypothetical protein
MLSFSTEPRIALPGWIIGWDGFCRIGHRRFARHWSIPQIREELLDSYAIVLSENSSPCIHSPRRPPANPFARVFSF